MQIKIAKLHETNQVVLPNRKHPTDAGIDLYAYGNYTIPRHGWRSVYTGVTIELPKGCVGLIWPKSSSLYLVGAGVIDQDYQGEIIVKLFNTTNIDHVVSHGDPVAQLLIQPVLTPEVVEVSNAQIHKVPTERGDTGGIKTTTLASNVEIIDEPTKFNRWWD